MVLSDDLLDRVRLDAEPFRSKDVCRRRSSISKTRVFPMANVGRALDVAPKLRTFTRWSDVFDQLMKFAPYLSCVGYAGSPERANFLARELSREPVSRICSLGEMQRPRFPGAMVGYFCRIYYTNRCTEAPKDSLIGGCCAILRADDLRGNSLWECDAPLIIWLVKKDKDPVVMAEGRESVNFNLSFTIYGLLAGLLCYVIIGFALFPVILVVHVVLIVKAVLRANKGNPFTILSPCASSNNNFGP